MKKFLQKILLILGSPFLLLYLSYFSCPACVENYGYPLYKYKQEQAKNLPDVEILFLGDSRVLSSINSRLIPGSINFAVPGSTPIDTYYILKRILHENPENNLKTIFFSFSWSRFGIRYHLDPILNRGAIQNFYNLEALNETLEYSQEIDPEFFQLLNKKSFLLKKYRYPPELLNIVKSSLFLNRKKNKTVYSQLLKDSGHITGTEIWGSDICEKCISYEINMQDFKIKPIYLLYLKKLIQLCSKNDLKLIYENIPFTNSTRQHLEESLYLVNDYNKFVRMMKNEYPNSLFSDKILYYKDSFFHDGQHMNQKGSEFYTQYLYNSYFNPDTLSN